MPLTSFTCVLAIALAAAISCQTLLGQGFAPAALAVPSTFDFDGTYYDVGDATTYPDSGSLTTTSATKYEADYGGGGTYTYTKTGANTAGHSYVYSQSLGGDWYSETGTFDLTFTSASGGTYTSSGSYQGVSDGSPFGGTFINGVGSFTYSAPAPEIAVELPDGTGMTDGGSKGFGPVNVGSSTGLSFTIRNNGSANLTGLALTKDGAHAADFTLGSLSATSLAPGASTSFTVTFTPSAAGSRSAATHLASNDADENPFDISLSGTGGVAISLPAALDQPAWTFSNSGSLPWTGQNSTTRDGVDSAKSGIITHSQTSEMSTTVTGPGSVSFWWKVSSESGYDYLRFYIDGNEQSGKISGTVDWTQKSYSLNTGSHSLKWTYSKDGSDNSGSDCGWVDQVVFVPAAPSPEIAVEQPVGTNITDGETKNFGSVATGSSNLLTFTIQNTGTASLTGLVITKDGTHQADFTVGTLGSATVVAGGSTTFTVTFTPGGTGPRTAAIHIASNDIDENPFDMNLNGSGTVPPLAPGELVAPRITIIGGNVNLTVQPSVAERSYQLQVSETMAAGTWQDLGSIRVGDGNNLVFTAPYVPAVRQRFYRLVLVGVFTAPPGFALIPAGEFQMGDQSSPQVGNSEERPVHSVYVSAFYMDKYEVTKELWDSVRAWGLINGYTDLAAGNGDYASKGANHPVHSITWYDVVKWCNARSQKEALTPCFTVSGTTYKTGRIAPDCNWSANGYRLPTEAEWEKAARGGVSGKNFPWGTDTITHNQANYPSIIHFAYDVSPTRGHHPTYAVGDWPYSSPVGSFTPNGYGLYDMAGNIWEWCWDWFGPYAEGLQIDPRGAASGSYRVPRGGSWTDGADVCRVADRHNYNPANYGSTFGFRVARSVTP